MWALLETISPLAVNNPELAPEPEPEPVWLLSESISPLALQNPKLLGWLLMETVDSLTVKNPELAGWTLLETINVAIKNPEPEPEPEPKQMWIPLLLAGSAVVAVALMVGKKERE